MPSDSPEDLLTLAQIATMSERSKGTIRRWVSMGHFPTQKGAAPPHGGSAPVLVRRRDIQNYLISSKQVPRTKGKPSDLPTTSSDTPGVSEAAREQVHADNHQVHAAQGAPTQGQLTTALVVAAELRGQVAVRDAQIEVAALTAERDGLAQLLEVANRQIVAAAARVADAKTEVGEWKDQNRALRAELSALRVHTGRTWWQVVTGATGSSVPLLPGPTSDRAKMAPSS